MYVMSRIILLFLPKVLLVTGGKDDRGNYLDSTELLESNWQYIHQNNWDGQVWREIYGGEYSKHKPMFGMSLINWNNRILMFGELRLEILYCRY